MRSNVVLPSILPTAVRMADLTLTRRWWVSLRQMMNFSSTTKDIIGPVHWTPAQVLKQAYGPDTPAARTVICRVLPVTGGGRLSNRKEDRFPSRSRTRTRNYGELFNDVVRRAVVDIVMAEGGCAAGPMLLDH